MIMKSYRISLVLFLTFLTGTAFAQQGEGGVKKTVNDLFKAMKTADTALLRSCFMPGAIMQTVVRNKEGNTRVMNEPVDSFIAAIARPHKEVYDERITFDMIRIDGELATVWAPYKFYLGDQFSHCGVDAFQLALVNGSWKILYLADTRRRQPCD